jgi:hypothetical protein
MIVFDKRGQGLDEVEEFLTGSRRAREPERALAASWWSAPASTSPSAAPTPSRAPPAGGACSRL